MVLSKLRDFRAVLLNVVTSLSLFFEVKRKRHYYAESCRNIPINVPFFTENAILENTKYFGKRSVILPTSQIIINDYDYAVFNTEFTLLIRPNRNCDELFVLRMKDQYRETGEEV